MDPTADHKGFAIDLVDAIFTAEGYQIEYMVLPYIRAIKMCRNGELDILPGMWPDHAPDFLFSKPIGISERVLVQRKGDPWRFSGMSSFDGRRIGSMLFDPESKTKPLGPQPEQDAPFARQWSWFVLSEYQKERSQVVQFLSGEDMITRQLTKLLLNRIDMYMEDRNVIHYLAKKRGVFDQIDLIEVSGGDVRDVAVAICPQNPNAQTLVDIFNRGLAALRSSGELARLLRRYNLPDWAG